MTHLSDPDKPHPCRPTRVANIIVPTSDHPRSSAGTKAVPLDDWLAIFTELSPLRTPALSEAQPHIQTTSQHKDVTALAPAGIHCRQIKIYRRRII
jgi:hypothetical protein